MEYLATRFGTAESETSMKAKSIKRNIPLMSLILAFTSMAGQAHASTSAVSLITPEKPRETTRIRFGAALRTKAVDELDKRAQLSGLGLDGSLEYLLGESLDARLAASITAETGSSQSLFENEYAPSRGFSLLEASAGWKPVPELALRLGAINQSFHESPLLFSGSTFPALTQELRFEAASGFSVTFLAEQAVASGTSTQRAPSETTPLYLVERLQLGMTGSNLGTTLHAGHFAFHRLTPGLAQESLFRGNTVSANPARFAYGYEGIVAGARVEGSQGARPALGASLVLNLRAPQGRNQGALVYGEAGLAAGHGVILTPRLELFRNESDSAPATYNSGALAHNNRRGVSLGLEAALPANSLSLEARLVRADVIEPTPFQSRFTGFSLSLRKSYELF
ncbi:MAG: hypothetical protein NDJ89_13445 [Oligoflexia bacterium]|nr:hypothetical protein [Oligoflexia bacterium]